MILEGFGLCSVSQRALELNAYLQNALFSVWAMLSEVMEESVGTNHLLHFLSGFQIVEVEARVQILAFALAPEHRENDNILSNQSRGLRG